MYYKSECFSKLLAAPFLIITETLIIRPIIHYDQSKIAIAIKKSMNGLSPWISMLNKLPNSDDYLSIAERFYKEAESGQFMHYAIYRNECFIGMVSAFGFEPVKSSLHLSFWVINIEATIKYIMDAILAVAKYYVDELEVEKIYMPSVVGNNVSEKIAKRLGFLLEEVVSHNDNKLNIFSTSAISEIKRFEYMLIKEKYRVGKN